MSPKKALPRTFHLSKFAVPFWFGVEIVAPGFVFSGIVGGKAPPPPPPPPPLAIALEPPPPPPTSFASAAQANATFGWWNLVNVAFNPFYELHWEEALDRVAEFAHRRILQLPYLD